MIGTHPLQQINKSTFYLNSHHPYPLLMTSHSNFLPSSLLTSKSRKSSFQLLEANVKHQDAGSDDPLNHSFQNLVDGIKQSLPDSYTLQFNASSSRKSYTDNGSKSKSNVKDSENQKGKNYHLTSRSQSRNVTPRASKSNLNLAEPNALHRLDGSRSSLIRRSFHELEDTIKTKFSVPYDDTHAQSLEKMGSISFENIRIKSDQQKSKNYTQKLIYMDVKPQLYFEMKQIPKRQVESHIERLVKLKNKAQEIKFIFCSSLITILNSKNNLYFLFDAHAITLQELFNRSNVCTFIFYKMKFNSTHVIETFYRIHFQILCS